MYEEHQAGRMWVSLRVYILSQILVVLCTAKTLEYSDLGIRFDGKNIQQSGTMNGGFWDCPWYFVIGQGCNDGKFFCTCPGDGSFVYFVMGCCYQFPSCGVPCTSHNCNRWRNCQTCRTNLMSSRDLRACNSCKKGYIFENGLCDKDDNECSKNNGRCEQKCSNTYGSYSCSCHDGFRLESDKHACKRIMEEVECK